MTPSSLHLVVTEQRGGLTLQQATVGAQLRASQVVSLLVVGLLECRRLLAYDEPEYALSPIVASWTKVCQEALYYDPTMVYPAEKQHARTWATRAIRAMDESAEARARDKAEAHAVARYTDVIKLTQNRDELTDDETAWAQAVARGAIATYLTTLDHGVTV